MLSVLLQELALAKDHGRKTIMWVVLIALRGRVLKLTGAKQNLAWTNLVSLKTLSLAFPE